MQMRLSKAQFPLAELTGPVNSASGNRALPALQTTKEYLKVYLCVHAILLQASVKLLFRCSIFYRLVCD